MIISHKHKFIFLKNTKVAGSSVEIALSKFCGPDDVITHLDPEEEVMRIKMGGRSKQNDYIPKKYLTILDKLAAGRGRLVPSYATHIRACFLMKCIEPEVWNSYFKFCIVRNPWDRVASFHYFRAKGNDTDAPKNLVTKKKTLRRVNDQGWGLYTVNNKVVVDMCCKYENLAADLETARLKIGLPEPLTLPHAKSEFRKVKGSVGYRELFNEQDVANIRKIFRREIELFNYEY